MNRLLLTARLHWGCSRELVFQRGTPSCPHRGLTAGWSQRSSAREASLSVYLKPESTSPIALRANIKACCERSAVDRMKNVGQCVVWELLQLFTEPRVMHSAAHICTSAASSDRALCRHCPVSVQLDGPNMLARTRSSQKTYRQCRGEMYRMTHTAKQMLTLTHSVNISRQRRAGCLDPGPAVASWTRWLLFSFLLDTVLFRC